MHHADLYRLGDVDELREVGLFEVGATGVVVVEWADRFPEAIPADALWVELSVVSPSIRLLRAHGVGERAARLLGLSQPDASA